ncbi:hypothetical protein CCACVL1_03283 [Corchorus capsularis]|uniref:Uncharacterized protein n=1 Tax=Corchorus capsularis TaxID=210143 RepID=A0A1R3K169_COCAP|nr:hypothetical protein CCACVL1_03283 [Corchorus capsularis]
MEEHSIRTIGSEVLAAKAANELEVGLGIGNSTEGKRRKPFVVIVYGFY